jgi:hypothetical protein
MAKFKYVGKGERVFPSLGLTVKSGQEFDAPDNFIALNVVANNAPTPKAPKIEPKPEPIQPPSAPSDLEAGE